MKRFVDYFVLRETGEASAVQGQFEQLRNQIGSMFQVLYRAAQKTWGKGAPSLGDKVKTEIISDLEGILAKLKGGGTTAPMRAECFRIAADINNKLNEAGSIVSGLNQQGVGATGRPVYDMMDVLKNIESKIMMGVANLEKSVLGQKIDAMHADLGNKANAIQGGVGGLGTKIGGLGTKMDKQHQDLATGVQGVGSDVRRVRGQVSGLDDKLGAASDDIRGDVAKYGQKTLGGLDSLGKKADNLQGGLGNGIDPAKHQDIVDRLGRVEKNTASPPQPLGREHDSEADAAIDSLRQLATRGAEHGLKIVHPYTGDTLDAQSIRKAGRSTLLALARRDSNFQVTWDGLDKPIPFNMGDASNVDEIGEKFYTDKNIDPNDWFKSDQKSKQFGQESGHENDFVPLAGEDQEDGKGSKYERFYNDALGRIKHNHEERIKRNSKWGTPTPEEPNLEDPSTWEEHLPHKEYETLRRGVMGHIKKKHPKLQWRFKKKSDQV